MRDGPSSGGPAVNRLHKRGLLAELTDHIARNAPLARPSYPELDMLEGFREIWSLVDMGRQLRQSQAQVPESAGPLNSSHLVHQALALMQAASPGYLQRFLSYLDTLSWLEQMHNNPGQNAARSKSSLPAGKQKP